MEVHAMGSNYAVCDQLLNLIHTRRLVKLCFVCTDTDQCDTMRALKKDLAGSLSDGKNFILLEAQVVACYPLHDCDTTVFSVTDRNNRLLKLAVEYCCHDLTEEQGQEREQEQGQGQEREQGQGRGQDQE